MFGSIRQKGRNSWQIQMYTGKGSSGKRLRYFETVRGTKGDAESRLREISRSTPISPKQQIRQLNANFAIERNRLLSRIEELRFERDDKPSNTDRFMRLKPNEELRSHIGYRRQ